jgi:hypothetical protein
MLLPHSELTRGAWAPAKPNASGRICLRAQDQVTKLVLSLMWTPQK